MRALFIAVLTLWFAGFAVGEFSHMIGVLDGHTTEVLHGKRAE